ncbi:DUF6008 family protein [Methylobacterium sp. WL120]|uniref:DUF6008 family protein n=1 Tax=Methylobacterium sp. WL120 TaxID=2603887 RepID=UPI0011CA27CF|nr:DUF6008 family protein [Methylobacterium sp. WL120]TXM69665.1 hypothetical protein FV229_04790 [Methylobacterium sp. WL120]
MKHLLIGIAVSCLVFQVGHFYEHVAQWVIWLMGWTSGICGRDTPWMSPWVTYVVESFGAWAWPALDYKVQMARSMEVLHIVGNLIFLTGLVALMLLIPNRWVKWGLMIETFHLYEHIMLTVSVFTVGKPIGMSTLFGGAFLFDQETAVGIRVTWHALMNLIPMPFAMMGIMQWWEARR